MTVHYIWVLTLILSNMHSGYKFPQHFRGVQKRCQLPVEKICVFFRTERACPFAQTSYGLLCLLTFRASHWLPWSQTLKTVRGNKARELCWVCNDMQWEFPPTCMVLMQHLSSPVVCVYVKANQLSVCFSTGSYQETYAAFCF